MLTLFFMYVNWNALPSTNASVLHYFLLASAVGLLQTVNSNLHSCNLLSLLVKNNLKSAGFLVAGPLTLCLSEQPRRNLSCDLLKNYDMNL